MRPRPKFFLELCDDFDIFQFTKGFSFWIYNNLSCNKNVLVKIVSLLFFGNVRIFKKFITTVF